jgi:hypothetical protein
MPTAINKQMLQQFRKDFTSAVIPLQKKYGLLLSLGSIRFEATQFSGKYTAILTNGEATSSELDTQTLMYKLALERVESYSPFAAIRDCFGKVFKVNNKQFAFTGIRPNARKRCLCILQVDTGKQFVLPISSPSGTDYVRAILTSNLLYDFKSAKVTSIPK